MLAGVEQLRRFAQGFLHAVAGKGGEGGIGPLNLPLGIRNDNRIRSRFKGAALQSQAHLRPLALGDVLDRAIHFHGNALGIEFQFPHSMHPAFGLVVVANDAIFLVESPALADHFAGEVSLHHRAILGMNQGQPASHGTVVGLVYPEYLVQHLRTPPHPDGEIRNETTHFGNCLRLSEQCFALVQRLLRSFALLLASETLQGETDVVRHLLQ